MKFDNFFAELKRRNAYKVAVACAVGAILAATVAYADEITVVTNVLGPEGPLFLDGNLYYVGWVSNTLSKWDGKTNTVLNHTEGCGHNGLALTKRKTFLLACTDDPGAILELDMNGKQLRRWDADNSGKKFDGGINDIVVTANGRAYATVFGPYADPPTPTLKFMINDDGSLSHRSNFALLTLLTKNKNDSWWLGPDSMKIDNKGNIYVAQCFGCKILKISPDGKLLHVFEIAAGDGTTNVAFGKNEDELYVTVVKDPKDPQAKGSIVKIKNVK